MGNQEKSMLLWLSRVVFCPPVEGLSLLGNYEDSDDNDHAGDSLRSNANSQQQPVLADIDSKLANFMAVSYSTRL